MASSYTTNSGIEKPDTGDQSGTWGATVNTNMDILDTIVSGFVQITASGTAETLTTTDGAVTSGMNRAIKYVDGGDLGGNCTVTFSPNDQEKLIFVENGLSASRTLIFKQGTGDTFTLQNGKQAIIKSDGAGSGADVAGVYANIQISTLECEGAAAIDGAATLGSTLAVTGAITASGGVAATGNVTATGTVEPAGDTSAADNAAFGYSSVLGAIITGQGSTNDVTLVNDADATVLGIATGTTNVDVVGDLTASTLNADGDTAAGDDAAIGWTSAEGIIITGQGSTNDVTIKNDADADVLTIPTGTTNVSVAGNVSLSDASSVDISTPLLAGADHTYTGLTAQMLAGGAISAFDLVCIHTTTQEVVEADASAYATARVIGIAPAAISDTATGTILLHGFIRDDTWTWTAGSTLYLSETAGAMTHTAPSTDGAFVLVIGVALSPDVVYINPSMDVIEHA